MRFPWAYSVAVASLCFVSLAAGGTAQTPNAALAPASVVSTSGNGPCLLGPGLTTQPIDDLLQGRTVCVFFPHQVPWQPMANGEGRRGLGDGLLAHIALQDGHLVCSVTPTRSLPLRLAVLSHCEQPCITIWDLDRRREFASVAIPGPGRFLAVGRRTRRVYVNWAHGSASGVSAIDIPAGRCVDTAEAPPTVSALALSDDESYLFATTHDGLLLRWQTEGHGLPRVALPLSDRDLGAMRVAAGLVFVHADTCVVAVRAATMQVAARSEPMSHPGEFEILRWNNGAPSLFHAPARCPEMQIWTHWYSARPSARLSYPGNPIDSPQMAMSATGTGFANRLLVGSIRDDGRVGLLVDITPLRERFLREVRPDALRGLGIRHPQHVRDDAGEHFVFLAHALEPSSQGRYLVQARAQDAEIERMIAYAPFTPGIRDAALEPLRVTTDGRLAVMRAVDPELEFLLVFDLQRLELRDMVPLGSSQNAGDLAILEWG